ncbi:synaptogyrin-3 [Microcaecilia unicolor]|uniref:Synaptogyrin n=1 Tax=Microcaecilia unicolor TaxID=1415580 RepID=A0A6P7YU94_9AMPH|nr:synaptogyrin-3 [Microcaecilia unicolor]
MEGASYGAGRAGGSFEPLEFLLRPQTILRIICWIFSIVVFASILNEGYVNIDTEQLRCIFISEAACNYGVSIGFMAFFACVFFFILDIYFPQISSVKDRKKAVLLDLACSGFLAFLWFVGFCFLTNQWQRTGDNPVILQKGDAARAAITFSFFSIISWVVLTVKAFHQYRLGTDMSLFTSDHLDTGPSNGYQGYSTGSGVAGTEAYQSPPFTETHNTGLEGYQTPTY